MAKEAVDGETQPKKKMSKKRKFLIALGVIAGLLVGAWVLVVTPAINKLATEQLQAAGIKPETRAEQLPVSAFLHLANFLSESAA